MGNVTLIVGGARSGKSRQALSIGRRYPRCAFVATCEPLDEEMRRRVALHRRGRPRHWKTFEAPREVARVLERIRGVDVVIVDCLTLLVSNLLLSGASQRSIEGSIRQIMRVVRKQPFDTVLVSNEVGLGIVPARRLARDFRDAAGTVNQIVARAADRVIFMVSGIGLQIKG